VDVVEFLERMGSDATLREARKDELERALAQAGIEPSARAAILAGDAGELERLLATGALFGILMPDEDEEQEDEGEGEEPPSREGEEQSLRHGPTLAAA
jgi:hypothetical protein